MKNNKKKIAVLGGGMSSLGTVFEITSLPDWQNKYDITIYQMGWRLGGKGASGRNQLLGDRIEEHGLHLWMGFYDNAFSLIQKCYAELGRNPEEPLATWKDAFKPMTGPVPYVEYVNGNWKHWFIDYPENSKEPGSSIEEKPLVYYILDFFEWFQKILENIPEETDSSKNTFFKTIQNALSKLEKGIYSEVSEEIKKLQNNIKSKLDSNSLSSELLSEIASLIGNIKNLFWNIIKNILKNNDIIRRFWILADLGMTTIIGVIKDDVLIKGFDSIDDYDYIEWLKKHGITDITLSSAPLQAIYSFIFAYENGDVYKPNLAAGSAIRMMIRMVFTYRGAMFWKMQAGMGDTIFAPLYLVLKKRGVKFQFFHKVKNLSLSSDKTTIQKIEIQKQVDTKSDYYPLYDVKGLPCWPSIPLYDQIDDKQAKELKEKEINLESPFSNWSGINTFKLEKGKDFDEVLLGIPVQALKDITQELSAANPKWKLMLENIKTVRTVACQLWFNKNLEEMGYDKPDPVTTGYTDPLSSWCDMSQLIERENWSDSTNPVKNISYFCGPGREDFPLPPYTDVDYPKEELEKTKEVTIQWLQSNLGFLFQKVANPEYPAGINWGTLYSSQNKMFGRNRFLEQYARINLDPSEKYTITAKGTTKYRLKPSDSGFVNLTITGDWVYNGLNIGMIEACTMSAILAARHITGENFPIKNENLI